MGGYSGKLLAEKLGWKAGMKLIAVNPPDNVNAILSPLPDGASISSRRTKEADMMLVFLKSQADLSHYFESSKEHLAKNGTLWTAWPKKTSGIATDLNENIIRDFGLRIGLVDVKVCAIDDIWSGLKFVCRLKDR